MKEEERGGKREEREREREEGEREREEREREREEEEEEERGRREGDERGKRRERARKNNCRFNMVHHIHSGLFRRTWSSGIIYKGRHYIQNNHCLLKLSMNSAPQCGKTESTE